ncbi:basic helix-loop-helix domain-containing protein [Aspergillus clavatus NRRL 1]|uniref:HLH transcription factor, putative n=1 Tax=Aspergillus clavatus (strain ATCC 1007 / CBS 513.65 / DSM 816 / NCTC 3887 / NRRL 1 / QM 1276 / 107) TaxID=344612 RepID=A1CPU7_ASPCL|nr:HLH transcription factor, putative [Aspergillus clavatus NRRL 1]EAW07668.1 HLH transcription factor, putative [Aspergillus clavatus NRRL 1]
MSRSRLPPTPAMSGELIIKEQTFTEGVDSFALPPAALSPSKIESASRRSSKSDSLAYFPASPTSPELLGLGRSTNPPRQTGTKRLLEDFDLPPPPTRTRKIIQMKPKTQSPVKPAATAGKLSTKEKSNNAATPANSKKKQPSATSAAGRKIARKTAHSLIERRRRSKMNEEFATLKDMIPACQGQDMHKLAILQASIEYVNYLERCIQDLKTAGSQRTTASPYLPPAPPSPTSPEMLSGVPSQIHSASVSPELSPSHAHTNNTSPAFSPRTRIPSISTAIEFLPAILPSPALGPVRFSEGIIHPPRGSWTVPSSTDTSPVLQPRFSNASSGSDADIDHEASAALLMLNRDRRGTAGSIQEGLANSTLDAQESSKSPSKSPQKKMGMSVKDLLIS